MNSMIEPPWTRTPQTHPVPEAPAPAKRPGNPAWVKGGPSPNPHGRNANLGGERQRVATLLQANAHGILEKQIAKALEGDTAAAQLVLSRVIAPLRPNSEKVQFQLDASMPLTQQVQAVLKAVADGQVAPDTGQTIVAIIGTLAQTKAVEDLEQRIIELEAREVGR